MVPANAMYNNTFIIYVSVGHSIGTGQAGDNISRGSVIPNIQSIVFIYNMIIWNPILTLSMNALVESKDITEMEQICFQLKDTLFIYFSRTTEV